LVHSLIADLTYAIWTFINECPASAHAQAYGAGLLATSFILLLGIASRLMVRLR
jgi:ABC-type phosphate transport system permease subunit